MRWIRPGENENPHKMYARMTAKANRRIAEFNKHAPSVVSNKELDNGGDSVYAWACSENFPYWL